MGRKRRNKSNKLTQQKERYNLKPSSPKHKYGLIPVNNLTYGNPNAGQDLLVREMGKYDNIVEHFKDKPYPNNDGEYATQELNDILSQMGKLKNEKVAQLCINFDEDLPGMMVDIAQQCGVQNAQQLMQSVLKDTETIIMKLKFYYNRIRPYQLANIYGISLNPIPTYSGHSPSYPSGHTIQAKVFTDILSFKYPAHQETLHKFADQCAKSRVMLGLHFPSDNIFGLQVAAALVRDERFNAKYFSSKNIQIEASQNLEKEVYNNNIQGIQESEVFGGLPKPPQQVNPTNLKESEIFGGIPTIPNRS